MTNEEIISQFPECEYLKKEDIIECVNKLFDDVKFYRKIYNYVMDTCKKVYPEPEYDRINRNNNDGWKIWNDYFYGSGYDDSWHYVNPFGDWIKLIEEEFISRNGKIHEFKEACKIAADKWCELLFGWHMQNNGALDEEHSFNMCALGTILAEDSKKNISEKVKIKAHKLIEEYYLDGCLWKHDGVKTYVELSCDYGPNVPLYELLVKAGIKRNDASNICPWKTSISIDNKDNCVLYHTYQHMDYL